MERGPYLLVLRATDCRGETSPWATAHLTFERATRLLTHLEAFPRARAALGLDDADCMVSARADDVTFHSGWSAPTGIEFEASLVQTVPDASPPIVEALVDAVHQVVVEDCDPVIVAGASPALVQAATERIHFKGARVQIKTYGVSWVPADLDETYLTDTVDQRTLSPIAFLTAPTLDTARAYAPLLTDLLVPELLLVLASPNVGCYALSDLAGMSSHPDPAIRSAVLAAVGRTPSGHASLAAPTAADVGPEQSATLRTRRR